MPVCLLLRPAYACCCLCCCALPVVPLPVCLPAPLAVPAACLPTAASPPRCTDRPFPVDLLSGYVPDALCSQLRTGCLHRHFPWSIQPPAWQHVESVAFRHAPNVLYVAVQYASVQLSHLVGLKVQQLARIRGAGTHAPPCRSCHVCGKAGARCQAPLPTRGQSVHRACSSATSEDWFG